MKILNVKETKNWLIERELLNSAEDFIIPKSLNILSYKITNDSGKKTVISRILSSIFDKPNESILWIDEYGIWPNCEDWFLFNGFRKSLNEEAPLHEKPGHLFSIMT